MDRDRDDEILGFDLAFIGYNDTDFNVIFGYAGFFQKVNLQEFNLCTYINFELPLHSCIRYELLEQWAVLCGNNKSSRPEVFCKKVFLEISQNSQENTYARDSFLIKLQAWPATLLKKNLWPRYFPVNFAKFPRTTFFTEHRWLLLK